MIDWIFITLESTFSTGMFLVALVMFSCNARP